jgi:hypothetical protein
MSSLLNISGLKMRRNKISIIGAGVGPPLPTGLLQELEWVILDVAEAFPREGPDLMEAVW